MTDYQEKLNEARANNRNLFGALGETGKGFNVTLCMMLPSRMARLI